MTPLQEKVVAAFKAANLDPAIGCAIIEHESNWNPKARSDPKASDEKYGGAWGLSQMLVPTARMLGYKGDGPGLWDEDVHIRLFIALVKRNIMLYGSVRPEDIAAEHNSGKRYADAPHSTEVLYVPMVMKLYRAWAEKLAPAPEPVPTPAPPASVPLTSVPAPDSSSASAGSTPRPWLSLLIGSLPYLATLLRALVRAVTSR